MVLGLPIEILVIKLTFMSAFMKMSKIIIMFVIFYVPHKYIKILARNKIIVLVI